MENNSEVRKILVDLCEEFGKEEKRLQNLYDSHSVKIDELDHKISNLRKNEDVDFRVFSPRNSSATNSEKISGMENTKEDLEKENKAIKKQLKYYSDKVNKLEKAISLLDAMSYADEEGSKAEINFEEKNVFDDLFKINEKTHDEETIQEEVVETEEIAEEKSKKVNTDTDSKVESTSDYITKGSIARIVHKAEFTERIISNDTIRAKLELKEIIKSLKELIGER